ncbi:MAG: alpha/beta hydrolase [Clostridiales bacterium]|nr:alpha/beta hydrolase [Clostridiales bacterium]
MLLFALCSLVVAFILAFAVLRLIAPWVIRTSHKIDAPGIDRMEMVEIGGIQQALYIRGQNADNPVILWVHGGPGNSMMPLFQMFQYEWENDFTVVHWDQRNVGKTYLANDPEVVLQTMSAERVLEDVHEVTAYVKKRLSKEKIILMGHSWGTVLGTMAVQTFPEDYSAYVGIAQVVNMFNNERVGYEKTLELVKARGNQKDIKALEAVAPYPPSAYSSDYTEMRTVRTLQSKYGLSVNMKFGNIIRILAAPYYSFNELINSAYFNQSKVVNAQGDVVRYLMEEADINNYGVDYQVPVYYIMGENDYVSPYLPTKEFFEKIAAPDKQIFYIPDADHMPFLSKKAEFDRVLLQEIAQKLAK